MHGLRHTIQFTVNTVQYKIGETNVEQPRYQDPCYAPPSSSQLTNELPKF